VLIKNPGGVVLKKLFLIVDSNLLFGIKCLYKIKFKEVISMNIIEYLRQNEGNVFYTVKKLPFTFVVENNSIQPIRDGKKINQKISFKNFETALSMWPLNGPGDISNTVRGSAYVFAIIKSYKQ
jgi:hypothetical protein